VENKSCGTFTKQRDVDIQPEIGVAQDQIETLETVSFIAYPNGEYNYTWDLDSDGQYESRGREVGTEFESGGEKTVGLRVQAHGETFEQERSIEVERAKTSSSISLNKDEVSPGEELVISYEVSRDIAENGYKIVVESPSGEKVEENSEAALSGSQGFVPDQGTEKGTFKAKLVAEKGFLSNIMRAVFGSEQTKTFEVIDASENLDAWRERCQENGFDPLSSSGRAACISEDIGPECFKENPGSECVEIADSVCDYYLGSGFNPDTGKCGE